MFHCPNCGSTTVQVTRKHTVWETFTITNVEPDGTYTEEDAGSFGDTIETGEWEAARCDECDAVLDLATLFPPEPDDGPSDEAYRELARDEYAIDGEIEIDPNAVVSRGDDPGAYVAAWVWVYDPTAPEED